MTAAPGTAGPAPAFEGQRPPFEPGNDAALVHGARSERYVGPLAARIAQELLEDANSPDHLREPLFAASVQAWARAEAMVTLLWRSLDGQDIEAGLAAVSTTDETETTVKGTTTRKGTIRSLPSVIDQLRRWETTAAGLRSKLGLDPASAARVGRDLALTRHMNAAPLAAALDEIERRRRGALTAGGGDV